MMPVRTECTAVAPVDDQRLATRLEKALYFARDRVAVVRLEQHVRKDGTVERCLCKRDTAMGGNVSPDRVHVVEPAARRLGHETLEHVLLDIYCKQPPALEPAGSRKGKVTRPRAKVAYVLGTVNAKLAKDLFGIEKFHLYILSQKPHCAVMRGKWKTYPRTLFDKYS